MPLKPLNGGLVLLVGVKASNFDDEIRNHPRIVMWESQQQHWISKDIPTNTRAVFFTRFIGHNAFHNVANQARKRGLTVFTPDGTGQIAKQVKELLELHPPVTEPITEPIVEKEIPMSPTAIPTSNHSSNNKLAPLYPLVDFERGNTENARIMLEKARELGIETTIGSLAQMVSVLRRKKRIALPKRRAIRADSPKKGDQFDVSVQMFDNAIKELTDMRQLFIDTMNENKRLREKLNKFKKFFEE